jgi:hypothetical protein
MDNDREGPQVKILTEINRPSRIEKAKGVLESACLTVPDNPQEFR